MEVNGISVTLESKNKEDCKKDCVNIYIKDKNVWIGVDSVGDVMVFNDSEERIYHLRLTEHGGFILKKGILL